METATLPEELKFDFLSAKGSAFYNMMLKGTDDIHLENGLYHFDLQPGAWFLAEFA